MSWIWRMRCDRPVGVPEPGAMHYMIMLGSEADTLGGVAVRVGKLVQPADFDPIVAMVGACWGRSIASMISRLFLDHFFSWSVVAEKDGALVGAVIGFLSPSQPDDAYVYFAGVAPQCRRAGVAGLLYERFLAMARDQGRRTVKAIMSPQNSTSMAFHRARGFLYSELSGDPYGPWVDLAVFARSA